MLHLSTMCFRSGKQTWLLIDASVIDLSILSGCIMYSSLLTKIYLACFRIIDVYGAYELLGVARYAFGWEEFIGRCTIHCRCKDPLRYWALCPGALGPGFDSRLIAGLFSGGRLLSKLLLSSECNRSVK